MDKEKVVKTTQFLLLAFVFVTIGFAIGKEVTLRRRTVTEPTQRPTTAARNQVVFSYVHTTIRCVTCNTIERLVRETIDEQFTEAVSEQRLSFQTINFQEHTTFAQQYEIVASGVVLHKIVQGTEVESLKLNKVWELYRDPPAFKKYLGDAIRDYLDSMPGGNT